MSASVFSEAEGGGHHNRGESKRKRRNSENKKIEAQEEGKEQKMLAGRGRGDSVGSSSEDETDANGRSVKKQLLSFWLTMEEKEKSEGSGFVRVQQLGRAANKGPTGGRGHPGGLKHRSRSFDNKNDFLLDQLTTSSPSASTTTDQDDDGNEHHLTVGSSGSSSGSSSRRGRGHHHHHHHHPQLNTRGGSGGRGLQTFHARNHSFSSPMPFHLAAATTATSLPSSPAMSPPSPLNASSCPPAAVPPSLSFSPPTASLRHFSSSPSLPAIGPLALPFRFGPDAQADLRRSASRHGEEEWERGDEEDEEKREKKETKAAAVPREGEGREGEEETKQEEVETIVATTCAKEGERKEEPRRREEVVIVVESREEDEKEKGTTEEPAEGRVKSPVAKANSFRHSPTFLALQQALDDEKRQEKETAKQLTIAQSGSGATLRVEPRPATSPTPARAATISPPGIDPSKILLGVPTKSIVDGPSTSATSEDTKQGQEAREKESALSAAAADEERSRREEAEKKKQEEEETKRREEDEAAKREAEEERKRKEEAVKREAEEEQKRKEEAAQREKEQNEQREREERARTEREAAERAQKEEEAKERQAKLEQEEKAKKEAAVRQQEEERRRQAEDAKRRQLQEEEEERKRKLAEEEEQKQAAAQRTSSGASSSDSAERAAESDKGGADVEARLEEVKRTYDARLAEEAKKLQLAEEALCAEREKRRELEKQNKKLLERLRETELLLKIAQQKEQKLRLEKKRRNEEDEDLKNASAVKKANAKATKKAKSEDDSDEDDSDGDSRDAKQQADDRKGETEGHQKMKANTSTGESESDSAPPSLETSANVVPTRTVAASKPQRLRCRASQSDQETDTTDVETDATETEEDTSDDSSASSEETSDSESTDDEDEGECEVSESDTTADEARQMERRKTKVPAVVLVDMPLRRSAEKKKSGTRKANSEGEDDKTEDDVTDKRAKTSREYVKQAHRRAKAENDSMTKDSMGLDDQRSAKRKSSHSGKDKGRAEKSESKKEKKEKKERKKGEEECDDDEAASTTTTKKLSRKMMKKNHGSLLRVFKGKAKKSSSPRANETAPSGLAKQIAKQRKKAQKEMEEREREEKKEKKRRAREERKRREEEEEAAAAVEEERQQHKQLLLSPSEGHRPRGASFDHRMDDADWEWQISETDSVTDESDVDRKAARQQREKERREVLSATKAACSASSPNLTSAPFVTPPPPPPPPGGIRSSHAATSSPPTPPLPPPAQSISLPSLRRKNSSNASSPPAQPSGELSPTGEDKETPRGRAQRRTIAVPNKEKDKEKRKKREKARSKEDSDASFDSSSDVEARKRSGISAHTADHPSVNWRLSMKPGELMQFGSFLELRPTKEVITKRPKGIFGAPLESLCDAQTPVPSFLEQAFLYLEEKALRTTGLFDWDVEASTVQFLRSALEGTGEVDFDSYGTHAVAELIKHFLECLPEPLIPRHLYTAFLASSDVQCRNFKVNAVHQHLSQLSVYARELVQRLCGFLTLYLKHSAHNKTTVGKLSAVFGPLVLRPTEEEGFKDTSFIQLNSSRTKRKCASAFQVLITEYETLFLHMPQVARYVVKDGQVLLQAAALPQLVEQMLDENFKDAGVADIVFLTHTYFTTSVDLLRELISIFDKNRKAEGKTWSHRLRMRILQLLKDWVVAYGTDLADDADFVNVINKFTKPGADSKCSPNADEDGLFAQIRFLLFSLEQKRKAPARLIRNLSSLNGVLLQGQSPLSISLHGVKQSGASSLPPSPHGAQSQEDLSRAKSSDALNIWASSPTILSGIPRTYSGSGASYTTTPRTSQPSSPYHSSSSVATRAPQSDNEDDESTQYDTQGEEEDSADDSDAAVGEERSSRDLARQVRIGDDEFLDLDAEETAKQLTLIDNQLFRGIPKKELLNKRFMTPDTSPHFTAMVQRFNLTASWVGSVVFEYEQPARRAKAISLLIDICQASLRLNNYNTVFALLAGLNNTAVSRLKLTWERVSRKHMRRFKEMMAVVSDAKNHSAYRQELLKARPPVVPYLALFSKDLFGVEESNTTITSDGLINFGKMRLIAKLISHFTSCQVTFPIAIDPALRALLKGVQPLSENELYERSYRLEPRKNT